MLITNIIAKICQNSLPKNGSQKVVLYPSLFYFFLSVDTEWLWDGLSDSDFYIIHYALPDSGRVSLIRRNLRPVTPDHRPDWVFFKWMMVASILGTRERKRSPYWRYIKWCSFRWCVSCTGISCRKSCDMGKCWGLCISRTWEKSSSRVNTGWHMTVIFSQTIELRGPGKCLLPYTWLIFMCHSNKNTAKSTYRADSQWKFWIPYFSSISFFYWRVFVEETSSHLQPLSKLAQHSINKKKFLEADSSGKLTTNLFFLTG